jgi:hypothetical protein
MFKNITSSSISWRLKLIVQGLYNRANCLVPDNYNMLIDSICSILLLYFFPLATVLVKISPAHLPRLVFSRSWFLPNFCAHTPTIWVYKIMSSSFIHATISTSLFSPINLPCSDQDVRLSKMKDAGLPLGVEATRGAGAAT